MYTGYGTGCDFELLMINAYYYIKTLQQYGLVKCIDQIESHFISLQLASKKSIRKNMQRKIYT